VSWSKKERYCGCCYLEDEKRKVCDCYCHKIVDIIDDSNKDYKDVCLNIEDGRKPQIG
jgi:hypothetical protein